MLNDVAVNSHLLSNLLPFVCTGLVAEKTTHLDFVLHTRLRFPTDEWLGYVCFATRGHPDNRNLAQMSPGVVIPRFLSSNYSAEHVSTHEKSPRTDWSQYLANRSICTRLAFLTTVYYSLRYDSLFDVLYCLVA